MGAKLASAAAEVTRPAGAEAGPQVEGDAERA